MKPNCTHFILLCFIISSCDPTITPPENIATITFYDTVYVSPEITLLVGLGETAVLPEKITWHAKTVDTTIGSATSNLISKLATITDAEIERQMLLNPELPKIKGLKKLIDETEVQLFNNIADASEGELYCIDNAEYLVPAIIDVFTNYGESGIDLVILMDRSTSMNDDLLAVKNGLTEIINVLEQFKPIRIGLVFYADKNTDGKKWLQAHPLTENTDEIRSIIQNTRTYGGGYDLPESVNDAIMYTLNDMNWSFTARRLVLLIGDAPSLEPPLSEFTTTEVLNCIARYNVTMNIYPIVIGLKEGINSKVGIADIEPKSSEIIKTIYPNPADNIMLLHTQSAGNYTAQLFDINGNLLQSKSFTGDNFTFYTWDLPPGVYIARIINEADKTADTIKFIVQHK